MNRLITIIILSLATIVQADEVKIIETETGVIAEYTGSPTSTGNDSEVPDTSANNDKTTRVEFITAQIEQLKMEVAEIMTLTGNETEDELATIKVQAAAKYQQLEAYANELSQLIDIAKKKEADAARQEEVQPLQQQNNRQEKKKQYKELKKMRTTPPPSSDTQ